MSARSPFAYDAAPPGLLTMARVRAQVASETGGPVSARTIARWISTGRFEAPTRVEQRGFKGSARLWSRDSVARSIAAVRREKSLTRGALVERLGHGRKHARELQELGRLAWELARIQLGPTLRQVGADVPLAAIPRGQRAAARAAILNVLRPFDRS